RHYLLRMGAQFFLPKVKRIRTWRNSAYEITTIGAAHRVVWRARYVPPTLHPVVCIAGHFDYFRRLDDHANLFFESWLGHVHDRIQDRFGMDIVQDSIGIQYDDRAARRENQYVGNVLAALLIETHGRQWLQRRAMLSG